VHLRAKNLLDQSKLLASEPSASGFDSGKASRIVADHPSGKPLVRITPSMSDD